ncbi:hypothetical protein [Streptomyces flaveus]|uniref:hypothetical protein n=1 Tax=Streptomyces flaveus TaxID=66370 RepID=UPI0016702BC7|nr:hypothetical protein [Streptomyces flaveus]
MGEHDQDQDAVAEPAQPPLDATRARAITTGLREAMDDIRRTVAVLAARVRDAHAARVWLPLGYRTELGGVLRRGVRHSHAQAYRLLDVARGRAPSPLAPAEPTAAASSPPAPGPTGPPGPGTSGCRCTRPAAAPRRACAAP